MRFLTCRIFIGICRRIGRSIFFRQCCIAVYEKENHSCCKEIRCRSNNLKEYKCDVIKDSDPDKIGETEFTKLHDFIQFNTWGKEQQKEISCHAVHRLKPGPGKRKQGGQCKGSGIISQTEMEKGKPFYHAVFLNPANRLCMIQGCVICHISSGGCIGKKKDAEKKKNPFDDRFPSF